MNVEAIERNFKEKVCEKLRLQSEGMNRYRVFTPIRWIIGFIGLLSQRLPSKAVISD
jgi:hypothetical protein